ncbi:MAG: nuclear transport factor 2 family protein, partial [Chloroflexota bacterium]
MSATDTLTTWLNDFGAALEQGDVDAAVDMFADECYWRDLVTFTWNIKTVEGKEQVADMLNARLSDVNPSNWELDGEANEADGVVDGWINFETAVACGRGQIRLLNGKCWTLLTTMVELKGHEEPTGTNRAMGVEHGVFKGRKNWAERKAQEEAELGYKEQPYLVIIGGGQGGIALGARMRRLGVPTIIIEKNERPGDSWRNRYKSLCLHDPVWYDHLPYLPFPDHWPVFAPKDKIGDWLEMYTKVMELNYWSSTLCKS